MIRINELHDLLYSDITSMKLSKLSNENSDFDYKIILSVKK